MKNGCIFKAIFRPSYIVKILACKKRSFSRGVKTVKTQIYVWQTQDGISQLNIFKKYVNILVRHLLSSFFGLRREKIQKKMANTVKKWMLIQSPLLTFILSQNVCATNEKGRIKIDSLSKDALFIFSRYYTPCAQAKVLFLIMTNQLWLREI